MTISLSALFSYDFLFHADLWIIFSLKRQKRKLRKNQQIIQNDVHFQMVPWQMYIVINILNFTIDERLTLSKMTNHSIVLYHSLTELRSAF